MRDQVQGEIEGLNANGAKRKTFDDAPASGGRLLPIQRQIFAIAANGFFFGGDVERKHCAIHFGPSTLDGLARFQCNRVGKFYLRCAEYRCDLAQHSLALEGRQPASIRKP